MIGLITSASAEDAAPATPAPAETQTEVGQAGGAHEGAFPPFDAHTFPSQLLWFAICFTALYFIMKRLIVPRLGSILDERSSKIAGDIGEAQRLRTSSDDALAKYDQALADARASAGKIAQTATDAGKAAAEQRRTQIEAELSAKLAEAEVRIGEIKTNALADVGAIAQEAASAVVSNLLGREPTADEVATAVSSVTAK